MDNVNELIRDEFNNIHKKSEVLGAGGQGIVFRTKDPNVAIKFVTDSQGEPITDKEECERYFQKLKRVRLLPLPEKLHVAVPAALLKDTAGYVMQLLTEMIPFSSFWLDGKTAVKMSAENIPQWLSGVSEQDGKTLMHYINTGGLRRRLIALSKCASIVAKLHGAGLVYGDISHNNVFISRDPSSSEVWLIDADNLRFAVQSKGSSVYTPKYGAPEIVQGLDCGRFRTDCHAFAVMAFYMLTMIHPFEGELVINSDWADEGDNGMSMEEKAYAGLVPWIDDEEDDSNYSDNGLPRVLVLTDTLRKLFQETFGPGRIKFWRRPSIFHWTEALSQAADQTILCPSCGMSWYIKEQDKCPYCERVMPSRIVINTYSWENEGITSSKPCWIYERELSTDETQLLLPNRIFEEFSIEQSDKVVLSIVVNNKGILLKIEDNHDLEISVAYENEKNDKFHRIYSSVQLPKSALKTGFWLFSKGKAVRLIRCVLVMEGEV